jgi:hypothetical protein
MASYPEDILRMQRPGEREQIATGALPIALGLHFWAHWGALVWGSFDSKILLLSPMTCSGGKPGKAW